MPTGKGTRASLAESLIAGVKKHLSTASSLEFDASAYTPAEVEASLQTLADLRAAVEQAQVVAKQRQAEEAAQAPALRAHMAAFVAFVKARFGDRPDILGDFGLVPKKVKTRSLWSRWPSRSRSSRPRARRATRWAGDRRGR